MQARARHLAQSVIVANAAEIDRTEAYPVATVEALTVAGTALEARRWRHKT